jgi:hypothetical protein
MGSGGGRIKVLMVSALKNAQAVNVNCAADKNNRSMSSKGRHSTAAIEQFFNG